MNTERYDLNKLKGEKILDAYAQILVWHKNFRVCLYDTDNIPIITKKYPDVIRIYYNRKTVLVEHVSYG